MPTTAEPIPMRIVCPECKALHIDEGEFATKPHHTHSCQTCGLTWRPAVVPTVGVQFLPGFKNAPSAPPEKPKGECILCGGPSGHPDYTCGQCPTPPPAQAATEVTHDEARRIAQDLASYDTRFSVRMLAYIDQQSRRDAATQVKTPHACNNCDRPWSSHAPGCMYAAHHPPPGQNDQATEVTHDYVRRMFKLLRVGMLISDPEGYDTLEAYIRQNEARDAAAQVRVMSNGEIDADRVSRLARLIRCIADDDGNSWQGDAVETLLDCGIARSGEIGYPNIMVAAAQVPQAAPRVEGGTLRERAIAHLREDNERPEDGQIDNLTDLLEQVASEARAAALPVHRTATDMAKAFHETYERLAPSFGYKTRADSAVPWEQVPEKNRALMIEVCRQVGALAATGKGA